MASAKTELFDAGLVRSAVLFKALGHPARLAILRYLAESKVCITGDISDELPLSRTTVNQHLRELKEAGLIRGTVDGVRVNYCLDPYGIKELIRVSGDLFQGLEECPECGC